MIKTHLTKISSNKKTGPIPVSTSSKDTCPASCPFKGNGCYAESGPVNIHWSQVSKGNRGDNWSEFLKNVKAIPRESLWRHNQAGDLQGEGDKINFDRLKELVAANKNRKGFTYTHYPMMAEDISADVPEKEKEEIASHNRTCVRYANDNGFTINISGNSPSHAVKLKKLKVAPVVSVVAEDYTTDDEIVVCPAVTKNQVSCYNCGLCQKDHKKIIGFPAHGSRKKVAASISSQN